MDNVAQWFTDRAVEVEVGPQSVVAFADNFAGMPASSVDLILTDPPFNIARESNFHTYEKNTIHSYQVDGELGWDSFAHSDFVSELHSWAVNFERVLRPGGSFAIFCADAYVSHLIDALTAAKLKPKRTFTWRKPNAVPVNRSYMPMSACEFIVYGVKGNKPTFNADLTVSEGGRLDVDAEGLLEIEAYLVADKAASLIGKAVRAALLDAASGVREGRALQVNRIVEHAIGAASSSVADRVGNMYTDEPAMLRGCIPNYIESPSQTGRSRTHPTEKPVAVLKYLVALFSNPGDLILDPFAGSGSTGEAALALGRRVALVEREEDYFRGAAKRLARTRVDDRVTVGEESHVGTESGTSAVFGQVSLLDEVG